MLLAFSILGPLLFLEAVIRVFGPVLPGIYDTGPYRVRHPTLGHFHPTSFRGWVKTEEFTTFLEFNPMGLRDPRQSYAKPPGTFRVLLLGDSFVEAVQVAAEHTAAVQLERLLNADGRGPAEVINAGVGGYGTGQELLLLEQEGAKYQPDVVVLVFYTGNDVANNNYRLELVRGDLSLATKAYWDADEQGRLTRMDPPPFVPASGPLAWLRARSVFYNVVETGVVTKYSLRSPRDPVDAVEELRQPVRGIYDTQPDGEWLRAWRTTEALLALVRDRTREMGVPLVLVCAPELRAIDPELWRREAASTRASSGRLQPDAPNRRLEEIAARLDVPYVDLLPALKEGAGREPVYYENDRHWSAAGHRVVAQEIARQLNARDLLRRRG